MGKLKVLSGREVRAILEAHGFIFISQKGSHMKMRRQVETDGETVTYATIVPDHKELRIGTLSDIVRQSGLGRELFEA